MTVLPSQSDFTDILSASEYNSILDKLQNALDSDVKFLIKSSGVDPTTSDIAANAFVFWKNTVSGKVGLFYNDAGTIKNIFIAGTSKGYITPDPTVTASPYTYTNTDAVNEDVSVIDGAITSITKGGQNVPLIGLIRMAPGESIIIAYTTAPTVKRWGY